MSSICLGVDTFESEYDFNSDRFLPEISPIRGGIAPSAEEMEMAVKLESLDARIQLVAQNYKTATYAIDQSIQAQVPSNAFRNEAIQHWQAKQSGSKIRAWSAVVLTVAGIASLLTPAPYLALVSVVSAVYAVIQFRRAGEASDQVAKWSADPVSKLALERKKAYEQGFSYALKERLKLDGNSRSAVLLPHEVEYLYHRYFDKTCVELSAQRCGNDQQKKRWLDSFRTNNPISQHVLMYVFGSIPASFSSLSRNFEAVAASLKDIEGEFATMKRQRKTETDRVIRSIESERIAALAIPGAALEYKLSRARQDRDRRLADNFDGFSRASIIQSYQFEKRQYEALYAAAILPITVYFNGKVSEVRNGLKNSLNAIANQEANAFSTYYEYAKGLVAATASVKDPNYVYDQQPFYLSRFFQIPELPKIEINFVYQPPAGVDSSFWQH